MPSSSKKNGMRLCYAVWVCRLVNNNKNLRNTTSYSTDIPIDPQLELNPYPSQRNIVWNIFFYLNKEKKIHFKMKWIFLIFDNDREMYLWIIFLVRWLWKVYIFPFWWMENMFIPDFLRILHSLVRMCVLCVSHYNLKFVFGQIKLKIWEQRNYFEESTFR